MSGRRPAPAVIRWRDAEYIGREGACALLALAGLKPHRLAELRHAGVLTGYRQGARGLVKVPAASRSTAALFYELDEVREVARGALDDAVEGCEGRLLAVETFAVSADEIDS